jgi:hypothetical protein
MSAIFRISAVAALFLSGCDVPYSAETGEGAAGAYPDADGDTILDYNEGAATDDQDGDGTPNFQDEDSDGDTIGDVFEAGDEDPLSLPFDSDGDGVPDFLDLDADDNCIPDWEEKGGDVPSDRDGDLIYDFADDDNDGDSIKDIYEIGSACEPPDSDLDGTPDFMDIDSDGDGIGDLYEAGTTAWEEEPVDTDGDGTPDYLDEDSDNDGFSDTAESGVASPTERPRDTDGDGTYDFADSDSDGDGLSDREEASIYHTDPYDADSDGDGYSDGSEVFADTDPLDPGSIVEGVYVVVGERTRVEEAFEFELTIQMGDVAFLVDTTCSMSGTLNSMQSEYNAIVTDLTAQIPDAEYGFATYDDYPCCGYGSSGIDQAFNLRTQITDDVPRVQSMINSASIHSGSDWEESSMEALYQGAAGLGYDMNCNGSLDATTDVRPFIASGGDAFGGGTGGSQDPSVSGGGVKGGFGFRDYALPVLVYATDAPLRDPDAGYGTPNGCPTDAGSSDVTAALADLGGYVIGIGTTSSPISQMQSLASMTGSIGDTNGDGVASEPLVFQWSSGGTAFRDTIVDAIETLVSAVHFETIALEIEGDEWGFVTGVSPDSVDVSGSVNGQLIEFTLEFLGTVSATAEDQIFRLTLNVIGDGTVLLDTLDILVVVPGTSA